MQAVPFLPKKIFRQEYHGFFIIAGIETEERVKQAVPYIFTLNAKLVKDQAYFFRLKFHFV